MENGLQELSELIKNGIISPKDIIKITEQNVKEGKVEPEFLTYMVKYLSLINILNTKEYINIQELVNLGFYDSIEEINENVDDTEKNCVICCIRIKKTVFIPCGHSVCCTVCSKTIAENAKKEGKHVKCLLCKEQVDNINKLYM